MPGSGASAPGTEDNCPESDNKSDPATPAPTSESPFIEKPADEHASTKSLSLDGSFSSYHEPLTPDSGCHPGSPVESPSERPVKKKRAGSAVAFTKEEMLLSQSILESSLNSPYQQLHPLFLTSDQFDHSSELPLGERNQLEKVSGNM